MISVADHELYICRAASVDGLRRQLLGQSPLPNFASGSIGAASGKHALTLVLLARRGANLLPQRQAAAMLLANGATSINDDAQGIYFESAPFGAASLAFVFPGQGAQYAGMLAGYRQLPAFADALAQFDQIGQGIWGRSLKDSVYGVDASDAALLDTRSAQAALGLVSASMTRTLASFGVHASLCAGHSYGELVALWHAAALDDDGLLQLTARRSELMAEAAQLQPGGMAALALDEAQTRQLLQEVGDLEIANLNTAKQTIVAGKHAALQQLEALCASRHLRCVRLKTAAAFHTASMMPVLKRWSACLQQQAAKGSLRALSAASVIANVSADAYSQAGGSALAQLLSWQMAAPVRWREVCERLYQSGARLFIEVGPGQVLSRTLSQNLGERAHRVFSCDPKQDDAGLHLARMLAQLTVHGVALKQELKPDRAAAAGTDNPQAGNWPQADLQESEETGMEQLIREYFFENGKMVERYFSLAEKIIDAANNPGSPAVLLSFLQQSSQIVNAHLSAHEHGLRLAGGNEVVAPANTVAANAASASVPPTAAIPGLSAAVSSPAAAKAFVPANASSAVASSLPGVQAASAAASPAMAYASTAAASAMAAASPQQGSELAQWLLSEIGRVTGFPAASIDVNAVFDDIGIDSLAFTDLFQRLTDQFPVTREQAKALFGVRSVAEILQVLQPQEVSAALAHEASADAAQAAGAGRLEIWLREELARVTGFPAASIEPQAGFDELGIDSLAFTELFQRFTQAFPVTREQAKQMFGARSAADILEIMQEAPAPEAGVNRSDHDATPAASTSVATGAATPAAATSAATDAASNPATTAESQCAATGAAGSANLQKMRAKMIGMIRAMRSGSAPEIDDATSFASLNLNNFEREVLWKTTVLGISPYTLAGESLMATESIGEAIALLRQLEGRQGSSAQVLALPGAPVQLSTAMPAANSGLADAAETAADQKAAAGMPLPNEDGRDALCRYVQVESVCALPPASLPQRLLLTGVDGPVLQYFATVLRAAGVALHLLPLADNGWHGSHGQLLALDDHAALAACLRTHCNAALPTPVIFFACDVTQGTQKPDAIANLDHNAVAMFTLAKAMAQQDLPGFAHLGLILDAASLVAGAAARGVARSLSHEWHAAGIKVSSLLLPAAEQADPLLAVRALLANPGAHDLELRAQTLFARSEHVCKLPPRQQTLPLTQDSVVLLFGGGVGIGAEVGIDLARRHGCVIVALGRTGWDGKDPYPHAKTDSELGEAVYADLKQHNGQQPVAIAQLQEAGRLARRRRALANTAQAVREAGGRFEYLCADVSNEHDIARALGQIRSRFQRIDGVIHAAGVVEDRLLGAKSVASFRRVLHTKANSALYLQQALQGMDLKFVVFFSSMVAHTGNAGQTDYCAANEVLNAVAQQWSQQGVHAVSMLWSVWTETGLAARGVQGMLEKNGLAGVSSADGTRFFHDELTAAQPVSWSLITSPGTLQFMRRQVQAGSSGATSAQAASGLAQVATPVVTQAATPVATHVTTQVKKSGRKGEAVAGMTGESEAQAKSDTQIEPEPVLAA